MSHIRAIGFPVHSMLDWQDIAAEILKEAQEVDPDPETGRTLHWTDGSAEMYFHIDAAGCFVPAFRSRRTIRVRPQEWLPSPDGCPYCAMLVLDVLDPAEDDATLFPLAVTAGNVRGLRRELTLGEPTDLGLSVFVERIERVEDSGPEPSEGGSEVDPAGRLAGHLWRGGFFPLGPFSALGPQRDEPRARINGEICGIEVITNGVSGETYRRMEIASTGGVYELVAEAEKVEGFEVGDRASVVGWLCVETPSASTLSS